MTVWVAESSLRTVTVAPGATLNVDGSKAKFLITIVSAPGACFAEALWEDPQAANTTLAAARTSTVQTVLSSRNWWLDDDAVLPNTHPLRSHPPAWTNFPAKLFLVAPPPIASRWRPATNRLR